MLRYVLLGIVLSLAAVACGGSSATPTSTQAALSSGTPSLEGAAATPASDELPQVHAARVYPNLSFERMTGMYQAPDGRIFVTEQPGRIRVFDDNDGVTDAPVFLDLTDRVLSDGAEQGMLGLAFAPDFATSGYFYVDYTAPDPQRTVVSRFAVGADGKADPGSELVILQVDQPFSNHNGGQLAFGPDGDLYVSFGDGGSGNDPQSNGQDPGNLLATILRIDVSHATADAPYTIPSDNPFAAKQGARGEVWAYGLRNPWRFSFDLQTGQLWAGDVGQSSWEEVDIIEPGKNYGWSIMEGSHCLRGNSCNQTGLTPPLIDYASNGPNCAVTGGFVYRGSAIPALEGAYVYGDYCGGTVWALRYDGAQVTQQGEIVTPGFSISSFAQDNAGELYVLQYADSGGIYELTP